jgi:hypothetical protein
MQDETKDGQKRILTFYDLGGIISEMDGLMKFLSNNRGTVTTALTDQADTGVQAGLYEHTRFKVTFKPLQDKEGNPFAVDVLHGNMALTAAKCAMFQDWDNLNKVLNTADPNTCRDIGRTVKNFNGNTWDANVDWVAFEIVKHKACQCKVLSALLISTGDVILAHAAPLNYLWGTLHERDDHPRDPSAWKGFNLLGKVWMYVREAVKQGKHGDELEKVTYKEALELYESSKATGLGEDQAGVV